MPRFEFRPVGFNYDLAPERVGADAWTFGQNVLIENDRTRAALGPQRVWGTPAARPIWGGSFPGDSPKAFYASAAGLHATDGTAHANITPAAGFGGGFQSFFTGGMFNGLATFNDTVRVPCYWAGALGSPALALPGWPANDRARWLRPFKYYLVCGGGQVAGVDAPYTVRWSVSAAPGVPPSTWVPSATNDAGNVVFAGAREPLVDAAPVRDALMIFERHAIWLLSFVGGAFVFSNRRILHTTGLLAPNAWGVIGSDVLFVADGDVCLSDGQGVRSILKHRMHRALFSGLGDTAISRTFVVIQPERRIAVIGFPQGTPQYCNRALVWDYAGDTFGIVDLPEYSYAFASPFSAAPADTWNAAVGNWDTDVRTWDGYPVQREANYLIMCRPLFGAAGAFEANSQSETPDDGPLEVIARKDLMPLGDASRIKQVTRIYPRMQGPQGAQVNFRVGVTHDPGIPVTWGAEIPFDIGASHKVDVRMSGRYVSVQVRSQTVRAWSMSGFDLEYQDAGAR